VEHPLGIRQSLIDGAEVRASHRIDQRRSGTGAAQLNQVRTLAVAITRRALGVDGDGTGPAD
jgi:hypothetical protein